VITEEGNQNDANKSYENFEVPSHADYLEALDNWKNPINVNVQKQKEV
jgi:hypothetical protein